MTESECILIDMTTQNKKPTSLSEADGLLIAWAQKALPEAVLLLTPPTTAHKRVTVHLYLLSLTDMPPLRGFNPVPSQLMARYLVTTWDTDPTQMHMMLNVLVFNAMRHPLFEVDLTPIPPELWLGFQVIPQPAFMVGVPVVVEGEMPDVPIVREPPALSGVPMVTLRGVVLGPGEIPLANVQVEYPSLQRSVSTNTKGQFVLPGLPAEPRTKVLRVKAKGKVFDLDVEQPMDVGEFARVDVPSLT